MVFENENGYDLDTLLSVLNRIKENLATLDGSPEEERKVS